MKITSVSLDDGRRCAALVQLLKTGRWDLSSSSAQELVQALQWIKDLAGLMAEQLKSPVATSPESLRIKSMGSLPPSKPTRKKK